MITWAVELVMLSRLVCISPIVRDAVRTKYLYVIHAFRFHLPVKLLYRAWGAVYRLELRLIVAQYAGRGEQPPVEHIARDMVERIVSQ